MYKLTDTFVLILLIFAVFYVLPTGIGYCLPFVYASRAAHALNTSSCAIATDLRTVYECIQRAIWLRLLTWFGLGYTSACRDVGVG